MKTGAKIAIGCVAVAVLAVLAAAAGLFGVVWWGKNKVQELTGGEGGVQRALETGQQIEEYQRQADSHAFTAPADGTLTEERLLKFLAVRRDIFGVYEKYKPLLEPGPGQKPDLSAAWKSLSMINELRLARAKALAREGMSQGEYGFMVAQVYRSALSSAVERASDGRSLSEVAREAADKSRAEVAKQLENPSLTPEQRRQLEETAGRLADELERAGGAAEALDAPPANVALFRKHEAEIGKYGMAGLELIGL